MTTTAVSFIVFEVDQSLALCCSAYTPPKAFLELNVLLGRFNDVGLDDNVISSVGPESEFSKILQDITFQQHAMPLQHNGIR